MTHICVSKLTIIGSDNGLSPGRRQIIIWTNAEILLIGPLGRNFNEILIEIHIISFKKFHLKMSSGKRRPSCLGLNVLKYPWFHSRKPDWFRFMTCCLFITKPFPEPMMTQSTYVLYFPCLITLHRARSSQNKSVVIWCCLWIYKSYILSQRHGLIYFAGSPCFH